MKPCKFMDDVKTELGKLCGEGCEVSVERVEGNNGSIRMGINLKRKEKQVSPVVYLNAYYEAFMEGSISMEFVIKDIYNIFMTYELPEGLGKELGDFENLKSKVTYRLVDYGRNTGLLEDIPYIPYCDLAVVFCLLLDSREENRLTALIHKDHMKIWGVDLETLCSLAKENTPKLLPPMLRSMDEVLKEIAKAHLGDGYQEEFMDSLLKESGVRPLYVLSNVYGFHGAAVILYDGVLRDFAQKLESDLLILPSSVHETLIIPYEEGLDPMAIKEMVISINRSEVAKEDVLSDNAYLYRRETDMITELPSGAD